MIHCKDNNSLNRQVNMYPLQLLLILQMLEELRCSTSHGYVPQGLNFTDSLHMSSLMFSSVNEGSSKSMTKGRGQTGSSLMSCRGAKYGWQRASSTAYMTTFKTLAQSKETKNTRKIKNSRARTVPVIRLLGSKTSIFSSKSRAREEVLGNLEENCCFTYCGSCRTYLLALSLLRKPRLASSGEPMSFHNKEEKYKKHQIHAHNTRGKK